VKRREIIRLLGAVTAAWPLAAYSQQPSKVPRVGFIFSVIPSEGRHLWEACRQGLREAGYTEGRNITLEPRWAEARHERLPALAAELVGLNVDVIVAAATPASQAAKAATSTLPIVIVAVGDPVKAGLVASLARPGGNVTGLSLLTPELSGKRLQLLTDLVPGLSRVAALLNPDNQVSDIFWEETQAAARSLGIELRRLEARNAGEIEHAFAAAAGARAGALIVFDDPAIWSYREQIVPLAIARRLPTMYGYRDFVDAGGLISYGPNRPDQYRRTAAYVDKILKGAKPADLPVQQPTKFDLVVNRRAAKAIGIGIPPMLIDRADDVIE
jgi:putative tryptophan/tyrosine transport system substrate-binding protein